jgi:hypothetical protein
MFSALLLIELVGSTNDLVLPCSGPALQHRKGGYNMEPGGIVTLDSSEKIL